MSEALMEKTFSATDAAFALQHGAFNSWTRELTRADALILPRRRTSGPGGGNFRLPHILELGFQLTVGVGRGRKMGMSAFWGLAEILSDGDHGLAKINALPKRERRAILLHQPEFEDADYFAHAPRDLSRLVEFPAFFFGEDFISRDMEKPTFFTFDPQPMPGAPACGFLIEGKESLIEVHRRLVALKIKNSGSHDADEIFVEQCDEVPLVNLTAMICRIEARLEMRMAAQEIRGA